MVEFSPVKNDLYQRSFAGDAFNSAVYMKRAVKSHDVSFLTAIGTDQISQEMELFITGNQLDVSTVLKSNSGSVGLYTVSTDSSGERSFSYWRQNSMARQLMYLLTEANIKLIDYQADLIFFSGITLAILDEKSRDSLFSQLRAARENGAKIAFDPNYRPTLWSTIHTAAKWINAAYKVSDIIFPGLDEEEKIFHVTSVNHCLDRLSSLGCKEIILKAGSQGMYVKTHDQLIHQGFISAKNVVDTTAAGDSFDGTYLAMRSQEQTIERSLRKADAVASIVVTYPGALIPETALNNVY